MVTEGDNRARYDGVADRYDAERARGAHRQAVLLANLPDGSGPCLDLGCGTGRDLAIIAERGWTPLGVDVSADQLRLARHRSGDVIQGDAERLPFGDAVFPMVVSCWTSTDVGDFGRMLHEASRVLAPGGQFLFYGVHPCFNGPHTQSREDGGLIVHPTYRDARRHTGAPWWGVDGIRTMVGGMRHVPLAEFLHAFLDCGLQIQQLTEPGDNPVPNAIVVLTAKPSR